MERGIGPSFLAIKDNLKQLCPTYLPHKVREDWSERGHLDKFPIGSYLKVKFFTKVTVTFDLLVRGKIFLYHLKAYIYSFFFESDANSFFAPFPFFPLFFLFFSFFLFFFLTMKGAKNELASDSEKKLYI